MAGYCAAVWQGPAVPGDLQQNLRVLVSAVRQASLRGAEIVLFPELFLCGYDVSADSVVAVKARALTEVSQAARENKIAVAVGYGEEGDDGLYNSCAVWGCTGELEANYRKVNLWGAWEKGIFLPGAPGSLQCFSVTLPSRRLRLGIMICFDVEFPEPARCLALQGAELLLVPTALAAGEMGAQTPFQVMPTRAQENGVPILYSNLEGPTASLFFCGSSAIVGPHGGDIARAGRVTGGALVVAPVGEPGPQRGLVDYLEERRARAREGHYGAGPLGAKPARQDEEVTAAVWQGASRPGDLEANVAVVEAVLQRAGASGVELVVFPELFLCGYDCEPRRLREVALTLDSALLGRIGKCAAATGTCAAVSFAEQRGPLLFNTVAVWDSRGELVHTYRKVNLWGPWERSVFEPGPVPEVVCFDLLTRSGVAVRTGVLVCFDIEFPEGARQIAQAGAELLLLPTALDLPDKNDHRVVPSRAVENHLFILYADLEGRAAQVPGQDLTSFAGGSRVLAPDGADLQQAGEFTGGALLVARLRLGGYGVSEERNPYLPDLRAKAALGHYAALGPDARL